MIDGSLLGTSRSNGLSVLHILVPRFKLVELLQPSYLASMLDEICLVSWSRIFRAEWAPWEQFLLLCPRLQTFADMRYDATIWAKDREMGKATDLQQAPYPRVVDGGYRGRVRDAGLKPRYLHTVPMFAEVLKRFVGIVGCPPPKVVPMILRLLYFSNGPSFGSKGSRHSVCVASGLPTVDDSVGQPETENEPGSTKGSQTIPGDSGQHNRKNGLRC